MQIGNSGKLPPFLLWAVLRTECEKLRMAVLLQDMQEAKTLLSIRNTVTLQGVYFLYPLSLAAFFFLAAGS